MLSISCNMSELAIEPAQKFTTHLYAHQQDERLPSSLQNGIGEEFSFIDSLLVSRCIVLSDEKVTGTCERIAVQPAVCEAGNVHIAA